jgi:invasion protein IalB
MRKARLCALLLLCGSTFASAQDATGPLFSTPAGRSTTGAPILAKPTTENNGVILDLPGGNAKRLESADQQKEKQLSATEKAPPKSGGAAAKTSGVWELQCVAGASSRRCQTVGRVQSPDGKQVILVMSLAKIAKTTSMQLAVPLGVAVQPGVKIEIDGAYSKTMPISRCTAQGCLVEGTVPAEMIKAMVIKATASIHVTTPEGKTIPLALPLNGFEKAFSGLND